MLGGGAKSKDFWPTVKPFLSNKGLLKDPVIVLSENSNIISDQTSVAGIHNEFYVNVANDIGTKLTPEDIETHPVLKQSTKPSPALFSVSNRQQQLEYML